MFKILIVVLLWVNLVNTKKFNFYEYDDHFDDNDGAERAPLNFAFTVLLYHSKIPSRTCVGVIITKWWILDNCSDSPRYGYEYFKVGWTNTETQKIDKYKIEKKICHKDYKMVDFNMSTVDTMNLFAAVNAICLHRSQKEIKFIPEIVGAVKINNQNIMPSKGLVVYFHNGTVLKKYVPIVSQRRCNNHFKSYFHQQKTVVLEKNLLCVSPRGISYDNCCNSQSLILSDNILIGIMAWSTGCFEESGIDPWVFTNVGHYIPWIASNTDWKTFELK